MKVTDLTKLCPKCGEPLHRSVDFGWTFRGIEYWQCRNCGAKIAFRESKVK